MQPLRPGVLGPAARPEAAAGDAGLETRGRPLLRAVQRRPALQPPAAGSHSRADFCSSGSGGGAFDEPTQLRQYQIRRTVAGAVAKSQYATLHWLAIVKLNCQLEAVFDMSSDGVNRGLGTLS